MSDNLSDCVRLRGTKLPRVPVLGRDSSERERRRAEVEGKVTAAARQLLADGESYADLSIEQIATRAGISRTAFYDYFRDKRELLMKLVSAAIAPIAREADELVGGRPSGPSEIPHTIRAAMNFAREERDVFRATTQAAAYDAAIAHFWHEQVLGRFIDIIERRIHSQQEKGVALPGNARATAIVLVMMVVETLYHHVSHEATVTDEEMTQTMVTVAVRAVYGADADPLT